MEELNTDTYQGLLRAVVKPLSTWVTVAVEYSVKESARISVFLPTDPGTDESF